jgi:hypothetical protein
VNKTSNNQQHNRYLPRPQLFSHARNSHDALTHRLLRLLFSRIRNNPGVKTTGSGQ